ncbi:hypothetical protein [Streptomyces wuyuanensis]|uniref:hypothetical protein n=1 Tax=Streptomyces wuyuanensis TaxID=1196353 RepID=UPI0034378216
MWVRIPPRSPTSSGPQSTALAPSPPTQEKTMNAHGALLTSEPPRHSDGVPDPRQLPSKRLHIATTPRPRAHIDLAIKQAGRSLCRYRVGAVLAKGGRVLARSSNRYRNHPGIDFRHATFHAEEMLLRRTRIPHGATVYVARVNNAGGPMLARPCSRCQRALADGGASRVLYTTSTGPRLMRLN